jgi:selenoprotein W-related protein
MSNVSIVYCRPCGYEKRATDTAAALRAQLKLDVNLIPGKGGIFEVRVGDQVVAKRA